MTARASVVLDLLEFALDVGPESVHEVIALSFLDYLEPGDAVASQLGPRLATEAARLWNL